MQTTRRNLTRLLAAAMLALCLSCLMGCLLPQKTLAVIPADKTIKSLPDGFYEVTPAWLQERYRYERWAAEQIKSCQGGNKQ